MNEERKIPTGEPQFDRILQGGLNRGSLVVFAGMPGSGKTILSEQLAFANAEQGRRTLVISTLSEPGAKTLRYLAPFSFFDREEFGKRVRFEDLGGPLQLKGLPGAARLVMNLVRRHKPDILIIDSFKVFSELAEDAREFRKFAYDLAVQLMAWECTAILLGEYAASEFQTNPLFSVVDGLILLSTRELSGEQQRFVQVLKMRGTDHSRDEHPFVITSDGLRVYAPRVAITLGTVRDNPDTAVARMRTGIQGLDGLLADGIPSGSSLLLAGSAGTGKTALALETLYRGAAQYGENGLLVTFEETPERLLAASRGLGLDLQPLIDKGLIRIEFVAQPQILVEGEVLRIQKLMESFKPARVVVDSISVLLHKIESATIAREKLFQLATLVQRAHATGFFITDVPYGSDKISRFGFEETVVDGIILLTMPTENGARQRYVEIYKLRNTDHSRARHKLELSRGGIKI